MLSLPATWRLLQLPSNSMFCLQFLPLVIHLIYQVSFLQVYVTPVIPVQKSSENAPWSQVRCTPWAGMRVSSPGAPRSLQLHHPPHPWALFRFSEALAVALSHSHPVLFHLHTFALWHFLFVESFLDSLAPFYATPSVRAFPYALSHSSHFSSFGLS